MSTVHLFLNMDVMAAEYTLPEIVDEESVSCLAHTVFLLRKTGIPLLAVHP